MEQKYFKECLVDYLSSSYFEVNRYSYDLEDSTAAINCTSKVSIVDSKNAIQCCCYLGLIAPTSYFNSFVISYFEDPHTTSDWVS